MGKRDFAIADIPTGQLNALVKNLGLQMGIKDYPEVVRRVNAGEWMGVSPTIAKALALGWEKKDGVVRFSVTSDGADGPSWLRRHNRMGRYYFQESDFTRMICSEGFQPTSDVVYDVVVLCGELFQDEERTQSALEAFAESKRLHPAHAEIGCLIREKFTDAEITAMGLECIAVMHPPILPYRGCTVRVSGGGTNDIGIFAATPPHLPYRRSIGFAYVERRFQMLSQ